MSRGDTTTARNYFEHARALVPGYSYIHMNLSILEAHEGNLDKALAEAQEAVRLAPELSLSHFYLGNALQKIGRTADAAAEYRRAVDLDPNVSAAKAALAQAALANPATPPELADEALMRIGLEELYKEGNPNAAAGHFRKVLEHTPTHYGAHFQLAMALDRAGKPEEAKPLWEQVLKLAEDYNDKPTADTARARLQRGR
jgi:tetratricopeptide (TPR) repeat protein